MRSKACPRRGFSGRAQRLVRTLIGAAFLALAMGPAALCQTAKPAPSPRVPSLLDPLNRRLPKWLRFSGEFRDRAEGRTAFNFTPGTGDGYDLTRFRLNLELRPQKWLRFFVQGQDAQAPGIDPANLNPIMKDNFDLRLGYAAVDAGPHRRVRLRVGRQELAFGAQWRASLTDEQWAAWGAMTDAEWVDYVRTTLRLNVSL